MSGKLIQKISAKLPRGAKLMKLVGIFSGVIWIAAVAAVILLKHKLPSGAEGLGPGVAKAASAEPGKATGAEAPTGMENVGVGAEATEGGEASVSSRGESAGEAEAGGHADKHGGAKAEAGTEGDSSSPETETAKASQGSTTQSEGGEAQESGARESAGSMPTREEVAALTQVAQLQAAAGDMEKAVTPMRRVLRLPTQDADLLTLATNIFLSTGNYREALGTAVQALAVKPDDMRTKVQAVEAQYRLGEVDKAMAAAAAVIREHPGELAMLTALGTMEVEMGPSCPGYGKSLQAALKLKPDYAPALYLLGRKAQLEGDYKDAETAFRKVVKHEPQNAKAHGQLGMALYHLGREKDAEKEYRLELSMNPGDYNTWFNLGELQMSYAAQEPDPAVIQSLRAQAMEAYLKALELNPDHAQAHYRVGVLLNGNGQYKEAIRHLEASLKVDSRHVPTLVQLSLAFENLKQPERARAYLTKAYEIDPLNKVVLFKLKQWS